MGDEPRVVVVVGLLTVNVCVAEVPPPGPLLVTEKLRAPTVAFEAIVRLAVICVALFTVVVFTVISDPKIFTFLKPVMKLVPLKITFSVCDIFPLVGEILLSVGAGLVNVTAAVWVIVTISVVSLAE